jgi:adenylate kinase
VHVVHVDAQPHGSVVLGSGVRAHPAAYLSAVELEVNEDALVERITGRYTCATCGKGYHDHFEKPASEDTCDKCGGHSFKRRPDDNEETVRTRMAEYRAKTAPILPIYEARGIVSRVDGMADMDAVTDAIEAILV